MDDFSEPWPPWASQVLGLAGTGVWEVRLGEGLLRLHAGAGRFFGFSPSAGDAPVEALLQRIPEDQRDRLERALERAWEGDPFACEHTLEMPDGAILELRHRGELVEGAGGGPRRLIVAVQDISHERQAIDDAISRATYDGLTGLLQREPFLERTTNILGEVREREGCAAMLYVDLDGFKRVNDDLGHAIGDRLLAELADRMRLQVRRTDLLGHAELEFEAARIGGDEFLVMLPTLQTPDDVRLVSDRLLESMREPFVLGGREVFVRTSIGVALFPDDADDVIALVDRADTAMYEAKKSGGDRSHFYSSDLGQRAARRSAVERELEHALERDQLRVHFQPRIELPSRRVASLEALLRWEHPRLGQIKPAEFIPIAEQSGQIVRIGAWVLRESCREAVRWTIAEGTPPMVAVNLSPRQFIDHDVSKTVTNALSDEGLPPQRLELEVTEQLMLEPREETILRIRELDMIGVKLALDDFGTGYSSLRILTSLPFHAMKLDRSLIREVDSDPSAASVVHALVGLGHTLSLRVVAEGIDASEQLDRLEELGCDEIQGFLLAAPMPAEEVQDWLDAWEAAREESASDDAEKPESAHGEPDEG